MSPPSLPRPSSNGIPSKQFTILHKTKDNKITKTTSSSPSTEIRKKLIRALASKRSKKTKTYATKFTIGRNPVKTDIITTRAKHSGQLLGTILGTNPSNPLYVTWDTGAGFSMIERSYLHQHFSPIPKIHKSQSISMSGVGNFELAAMTEWVYLEIRMVTEEWDVVSFLTKVWICDGYLVEEGKDVVGVEGRIEAGVLIGCEFLRNFRLGVEWGEEGSRDWLRYRGVEGEWRFPCLTHRESEGS